MSNPTTTCAQCLNIVFLADDNIANISLDLHSFIAQNIPKFRYQPHLTHFPLLKCDSFKCVLYHLLKENLWYFVVFGQKSGSCILHSFLLFLFIHLAQIIQFLFIHLAQIIQFLFIHLAQIIQFLFIHLAQIIQFLFIHLAQIIQFLFIHLAQIIQFLFCTLWSIIQFLFITEFIKVR